MKMLIKLAITCILCLGMILVLYVLGVLLFALITEFNPPKDESLTIDYQGNKIISTEQHLSLLSWNIGYGGLGKEMDFFYEGGKMVRPDKSISASYLQGITDFLKLQDSIDFVLLQEVDFDSKRSYDVNQLLKISEIFPEYIEISAVNYLSGYVPVPFLNPVGKVKSGLANYSKYLPIKANRFSTPGKYTFPKRLFMLKRCLLVARYKTDNNKELVLINLHNSAFDDADALRKEEMNFVRQIITEEYEKGNYVIAGGDWNQNPPEFDPNQIEKYNARSVWPIDKDFFPENWNWDFDAFVPTNRDVHEPFNLQTTTCTILDFFVTSPNIDILATKTIDLEFEFSDHQPVIINLRLN